LGNIFTTNEPTPTVDIIELVDRPHRPIRLIERHNPPLGWQFKVLITGNQLKQRDAAEEETGLHAELVEHQVYSDPSRDPRQHTMSVVLAMATGEPKAGDDAKGLGMFESWRVPTDLCFDHDRILRDWHFDTTGYGSIVLVFY